MMLIDFMSGAIAALFAALGWLLEIPSMICYGIADMFYVTPQNNEEDENEEE